MQQLLNDVLSIAHRFWPNAVIAGGAPRDVIFDKPVKDIDIWIPDLDLRTDPLDCYAADEDDDFSLVLDASLDDYVGDFRRALRDELEYGTVLGYVSGYVGDFDGVWPNLLVSVNDSLPDVNLLFVDETAIPEWSTMALMQRFDFGINQIALETPGVPFRFTRQAYEDVEYQQFTLVRTCDQHQYDRLVKRVKRFKMKYPDFAFVVPEALVRDVERDPTL